MKHVKKIICCSFLLLAFACKEKYVPNISSPVTGYLVVEGFINSGTGPTTITLSRSTKLTQVSNTIYETKASVRVEGQTNTTGFALTETTNGVYTNPQLTLNANDQYRVHIKTTDGKEYVSDYSAIRSTPDIDSVSWQRQDGGVQLYVSAHDAQAKTKYYQYKYDETWEFHSHYTSSLKLVYNAQGKVTGLGYRDSVHLGSYDSTIFKCWKTASNTNIVISTSEKLTQDVIYLQPVLFIPPGDVRLSVLYSINVKQYAVSQSGYRFLEQLKKNTEQLGSIFDAQPSDNNGNIHCVTNPSEVAIGFVEVSQEKLQRIFISRAQVPDWAYVQACADELQVPNNPDSLRIKVAGSNGSLTNVFMYGATGGIDIVLFAEAVCVDCTLRGTNKKPSFWP